MRTVMRKPPSGLKPLPNRKVDDLMTAVGEIRKYANTRVFERERETDGILLTILSGSSLLFVGDVGTSKTRHINIVNQMMGLTNFSILMSQTTKPELIFGPTDVPALAKGKLRFKTEGFLPTADTAFFDEIFKANDVVLNPLLWAINENLFRNGEDGVQKIPLMATFAASNELPTSATLRAIYDRFLLRYEVNYLNSARNIDKMIVDNLTKQPPPPTLLSKTDVIKLRDMVPKVEVPVEVRRAARKLRDQTNRACSISISDRRLVRTVQLMQANAMLNGRLTCKMEDLEVCANTFWEKLENQVKARAIAFAGASTDMADLSSYEEIAKDVWETAVKTGDMRGARVKLKELYNDTKGFDSNAGREISTKVLGYLRKVREIIKQRGKFVILELHTSSGCWFKLTTASSAVWTPEQLRAVGFHWRKAGEYWWQEGPRKQVFLKKARNKLTAKIEDKMHVTPVYKKIG